MAVRLERKLFTIFKWVLILLPFIIVMLHILGAVMRYIRYTKVFSSESYTQISQDYQEINGGSMLEDELDYNDIDTALFINEFKDINNRLTSIMHINLRVDNTTYKVDIFNTISYKIGVATGNLTNNYSGWSDYQRTYTYTIMLYLSYIIMIEIIFMVLYMFRFFIHFFINLFERKEDIVK